MQKEFPEDYDFFPMTYILPQDIQEFKKVLLPRDPEPNDLSLPKKKQQQLADKEK